MAEKTYTTFNKIRFSLFIRSYAYHCIRQFVKTKYKINDRLPPKILRQKYYCKRTLPEISKLAKVLNFKYEELWEAIIVGKCPTLHEKSIHKEKIKIFLSIENEITTLAKQKQNKSDYFDPDYESDFALLSVAVERAIGNALEDIEDDMIFSQQLEMLKTKYTYGYYKMAYKYKLPTLRLTPFVIRLISSK